MKKLAGSCSNCRTGHRDHHGHIWYLFNGRLQIRDFGVKIGITGGYAVHQEVVSSMLDGFLKWLHEEESRVNEMKEIDQRNDAIAHLAALAHIYFVMIHPFGDGNGRMARFLVIYILEKNGNRLHPIKQIDYQNALRPSINTMNVKALYAKTFDDLYQAPVAPDFKNLILHNMVTVVDAGMNTAIIKRNQHYSVGLNRKGGIDFTSDKAMSLESNGQGIKFHIDPAQFKKLENALGFVPMIISIEPMINIRKFLGIMEQSRSLKII